MLVLRDGVLFLAHTTHLFIEPDLDSSMRLEQLENKVDGREQDSAPTAASTTSHDNIVLLSLLLRSLPDGNCGKVGFGRTVG